MGIGGRLVRFLSRPAAIAAIGPLSHEVVTTEEVEGIHKWNCQW